VQLGAHGAKGLEARKPGRKPKLDAKDLRIAAQEKRIAQLERRMYIANALIELQKKRICCWGSLFPRATRRSDRPRRRLGRSDRLHLGVSDVE
jgi:hypothetical protein